MDPQFELPKLNTKLAIPIKMKDATQQKSTRTLFMKQLVLSNSHNPLIAEILGLFMPIFGRRLLDLIFAVMRRPLRLKSSISFIIPYLSFFIWSPIFKRTILWFDSARNFGLTDQQNRQN